MSTWKRTDNNEETKEIQDESQQQLNTSHSNNLKTTSMTTLILWNINKALENNPTLNLKEGLRNAHDNLENDKCNVSAIISQRPDQRHLSCAMLAWQQLGHKHVDSLYSFVMAQIKVEPKSQINPRQPKMVSVNVPYEKSLITHKEPDYMFSPMSSSMSPAMGPVLRLPVSPPAPVAPRVAMPSPIAPRVTIPVYNVHGACCSGGLRKTIPDIKKRIESACCLESACIEKLTALDKGTKELRERLARLAKREAERIELLTRAERVWRDLEMSYMRRLRQCTEKEGDTHRRCVKLIEERNADKDACVKMVKGLKPRGEAAEKTKKSLAQLEMEVCARACERMKISELAAKEDGILCELQCQSDQQDRDSQFKEEAASRKKASLQHELESVRGLTYESERTMKAELQGFRAQLECVAKELMAEDEAIKILQQERDELTQERQNLIDDLEGCQNKCDLSMQKLMDQLKEKRANLIKLKDQKMECKCKFPMETAVQVKRTPSLAALCYCSPEDRVKKTCSCMSIRSRLLTDLIMTLFEGLQFEMADSSIKMPCELLKCLEDSHNWDKASHVKTNLRSYFAKLLCGELDIAIVNSIENYHARYVGASCADMGRPIHNLSDEQIQGWQDRALAEKAHWMAEAMADKMFKERVDDIMEQAHKVVKDGPPPCKCGSPEMDRAVPPPCKCKPHPNMSYNCYKNTASIYQLLVDPVMPLDFSPQEFNVAVQQPLPINKTPGNNARATNAISANKQKKKTKEVKNTVKMIKEPPSSIVARTFKNDVILLKAEIEDLKKDSIKKHELKKIEQTIKKLVQKASSSNNQPEKSYEGNDSGLINNSLHGKNTKPNSSNGKFIKKKKIETKFKRQYSVNMCFCGLHKNSSSKSGKLKLNESAVDSNAVSEQKSSGGLITQNIYTSQSKPILTLHPEEHKQLDQRSSLEKNKCGSKCKCFHKIPSTSSIDRLLDTLTKWKIDLNEPPDLINAVESNVNMKKSPFNCPSNSKDTRATVCQLNIIKGGCKKEASTVNKSDTKINKQSIPEDNSGLPEAESKYMRTINFEKSNENVSKCVNVLDKSRENINIPEKKVSKSSRNSIQSKSLCKLKSKIVEGKCVESKNERKVKSEEYKTKKHSFTNQRKIKSWEVCKESNKKDKNDNISFANKPSINNKLSSSLKIEEQDKNEVDILCKPFPLILVDNTHDDQQKERVSVRSNYNLQASFSHNLIDPGDLPCGCEYQIKLIGVTLDSINTGKKLNKRLAEEINNVSSFHPKPIKYQIQEAKAQDSNASCILSSTYPQKTMENYNLFKKSKTNVNVTELHQPLCRCKSKLNEIKRLLLGIDKDKEEIKDDKALDTNSLQVDSKFDTENLKNESSKFNFKDENCVCCVDLTNESNELEVNMFQLLQEHIRKKLKSLKDTCQSSYCIKPDEEDKVLKRLFRKIKQTVTDDTGMIACKCSEETDSKGSWQRAYNLLQEYLRLKISRVECNCSPNQSNKATILPELTDKVCILIEKDFERLRDICKCRRKDKPSFDEETKFQMPEKDLNSKAEKNYNSTLKKSSIVNELTARSYIIATHNTSAQVIPNFETKSCEAIKFSNPFKTTVETQSLNECIDCNSAKNFNSQSTQYSKGDYKEMRLNPSLELCLQKSEHILTKYKELAVELQRKENKSKDHVAPYIGLTIDCTCSQNLDQCGCTKAKIDDNNKAISEYWATYSKSKVTSKNVSYLMNNVHKKLSENITDISNVKKSAVSCAITNRKVNTKRVGGLTLKDSQEYLNKDSCQGETNTEGDIYSSATDDSSEEDWYEENPDFEAGSDPVKQPKKKSVHFLNRSKSEILTTEGSNNLEVYNHTNCDCSKVPVCHVKMLMENIGFKLANSECTCDSLSSKVCPVHSKIVA